MKEEIVPYDMLRHTLDTGDEIICSGKGLASALIKIGTGSFASHVGKIVKIGNVLFIWQSTSLSKGISGPQLEQLSTWLKKYKGKVWIRRLVVNRTDEFRKIYTDTIAEFRGREYEQNLLELLGSAMPWRNEEDLSTIFCSEQNAEIDKRTGVIETELPSNEFTPKDSLPGRLKDSLVAPGVKFGPLMRIAPATRKLRKAA